MSRVRAVRWRVRPSRNLGKGSSSLLVPCQKYAPHLGAWLPAQLPSRPVICKYLWLRSATIPGLVLAEHTSLHSTVVHPKPGHSSACSKTNSQIWSSENVVTTSRTLATPWNRHSRSRSSNSFSDASAHLQERPFASASELTAREYSPWPALKATQCTAHSAADDTKRDHV